MITYLKNFNIYVIDTDERIAYRMSEKIHQIVKKSLSPFWQINILKKQGLVSAISVDSEFSKAEGIYSFTESHIKNEKLMENTAKKVDETTGAYIQSSQKIWLDENATTSTLIPDLFQNHSIKEVRLCLLNSKLKIDSIESKNLLPKSIGLIDYSKASVIKDDSNKKSKTYKEWDYLLPLLSKQQLDLAYNELTLDQWKELVYLTGGVSYYCQLESKLIQKNSVKEEDSPDIPQINIPGLNKLIKRVVSKLEIKPKEAVLRTPSKKRVKALTLEFEAGKRSKKRLKSNLSKSQRNKQRRAKEKLNLQLQLDEIKQNSTQKVGDRVKNKIVVKPTKKSIAKLEFLSNREKIQKINREKRFVKTKHSNKSKNRKHLHYKYVSIKEKWFTDLQEAKDFATSSPKIKTESIDKIGEEYAVTYRIVKDRKYKFSGDPETRSYKRGVIHKKKSMNYVKVQPVISTKKIKIKSKPSLVCITNDELVYRISSSLAELAISSDKGFKYTSKSNWKKARLEGKDRYYLDLDIRTPKEKYKDRVVKMTESQSKQAKLSKNKVARRKIKALDRRPELNHLKFKPKFNKSEVMKLEKHRDLEKAS